MSTATSPAVESAMPPRAVLRVVNPIIRGVLRSPLHRLVSKKLVVLTVTGRTTGRPYSMPVGRHEVDGELLVSASGAWRCNLRGGAPVVVTIDGRDRVGHADLEEDPDKVAATFAMLLDELGTDHARDLGLKVNIAHRPTAADIKPAVASRAIARIRISDRDDSSLRSQRSRRREPGEAIVAGTDAQVSVGNTRRRHAHHLP